MGKSIETKSRLIVAEDEAKEWGWLLMGVGFCLG